MVLLKIIWSLQAGGVLGSFEIGDGVDGQGDASFVGAVRRGQRTIRLIFLFAVVDAVYDD
jgi:hypothetical protein